MAQKSKKLGEILYGAKLVPKEALIEAIKTAKNTNKRLGEVLIEHGHIDEDTLTKALSKQFGIKYINLDSVLIPGDATSMVPEDLMKRHNILPLGKTDGKLQLVIGDPTDLETLDTLKFRLKTDIEFLIGCPSKIKGFLQSKGDEKSKKDSDALKNSIDATAQELREAGHELRAEILKAEAIGAKDDGPIVRLANMIIDGAYRVRASDIHIEPMVDRVRIRYRIDGECLEKENIPKNMQAPLLTRFKILAGMDIAEKRLPQDGRIKRNIDGSDIDFRVSALPANHGESMVLRILRPDAVNIGIQSLGFASDDYDRFQRIIRRPNGIFLVTGPTGSGKTTTLYAALQELNRPDKKIITAEDPVEYNFPGMNQCQVRDDIGLTFDRILRAMLRQAPNIILIGEIRDGTVADIAIQAALTGHLVFSTLHTNDAISAITRLIDMGVKPFLVASSIQAIMAQRLVRVICKQCKEIDKNPDVMQLKQLGITEQEIKTGTFFKGKGCPNCQNTGYRGRIAVFEMLEMNNEIRELAFSKAPTTELREASIASGMRTLLDDGKVKIFNGLTTAAEIVGITQTQGITK